MISKTELISLLNEKKVKGIFQPHIGFVSVDLKNGTTKYFQQERLDWIIEYAMENHGDELEYIAME